MIKKRIDWLNSFIDNSIFKKAEIARKVGISPVSLRDLLLYGRKSINKEKFFEICSLLRLNPEFFYSQKVEMPFYLNMLYKLRIKELISLIGIFSPFKTPLSTLVLIFANTVYYLLLKFIETPNIFFLIAHKKPIGNKNQPFGSFTKINNNLNIITQKTNLSILGKVSIELENNFTQEKDLINLLFERWDYIDCEKYFIKDLAVTLKPCELELIYYLKNIGIHNKKQLFKIFNDNHQF